MGISTLGLSFGFGESWADVQKEKQVLNSSDASSKNDFDFLLGKWKITNRKLKVRLNNSNEWEEFEATGEMFKILNGLGNTDNFIAHVDGKPFEGRTLRLFNPKTRLWSIYWADSNAGVLDAPVTGSFDGSIGKFYTKDVFNGREIMVLFQWDKTNPDKPVWSQAFSTDKGTTWEWNWYMNFSRTDNLNSNQIIKVIELRNYLLKPNALRRFHNFFRDHFVESQHILNGYILGQFQIRGIDDRFFWIRGFHDMASRMTFLTSFYDQSLAWKKHGSEANEMMLDSDQAHLLRPLNPTGDWRLPSQGIIRNDFLTDGSVIVINYYFAKPDKFEELIEQFRAEYKPNRYKENGTTLWITEQTKSEFRHPVIQANDLLVTIRSFANEERYAERDEIGIRISHLLSREETVVLFRLPE